MASAAAPSPPSSPRGPLEVVTLGGPLPRAVLRQSVAKSFLAVGIEIYRAQIDGRQPTGGIAQNRSGKASITAALASGSEDRKSR